MNRFYFACIALCIGLLCACTSSEEREKAGAQHFDIDIKKSSDPEWLQETLNNVQARLVPLESQDTAVFGGSEARLFITSHYYVVVDVGQEEFFFYDKKGNLHHSFARKGQGPEEYASMRGEKVTENAVYVSDGKKIQVYDPEGNFQKTIGQPKEGGRQFWVTADNRIVQSRPYTMESQLVVYDMDGKLLQEYFPTPDVLRSFKVVQSVFYGIGEYKGGIYLTNPFDMNLYYLKDTITTLADFHFGSVNMPDGYLQKPQKEVLDLFNKASYKHNMVYKLDDVIVTDDWIVFIPHRCGSVVVYCNRKNNQYMLNKDFCEPYKTLLGGYDAPLGYNEETGEFYLFVSMPKLKEAIEKLAASDVNYQDKYPFLKGIDPEKIDEEANDWILFFKV